MKILLVDESVERYSVLDEVASLSGSKIVNVPDIEEAKNLINTKVNEFQAIIVFPRVNGVSTLQLLAVFKKNPYFHEIPFIIIAENPTKEELEYYKTIGVSEVFEIPFNPLEIFLFITNYLKERKGEEEVRSMLKEDRKDMSLIEKIIAFIKKIFGFGA